MASIIFEVTTSCENSDTRLFHIPKGVQKQSSLKLQNCPNFEWNKFYHHAAVSSHLYLSLEERCRLKQPSRFSSIKGDSFWVTSTNQISKGLAFSHLEKRKTKKQHRQLQCSWRHHCVDLKPIVARISLIKVIRKIGEIPIMIFGN